MTSTDELDVARYSVAVADALGSTLHLERTLGRVADLAVPALAPWASVTLLRPDHLLQAGAPRQAAVRRVPRPQPPAPPAPGAAGRDALHLLGIDDAWLSAVGGPQPEAVAVALHAAGEVIGVLALGAPCPESGKVEALVRRGAAALAAALAHDERRALAEALRRAVMPPPLPEVPGMQVGAAYRAASVTTEVGGDFYEVRADGDGWAFTLGDVCGKGVDAAVRTSQVRQSLRTAALVDPDPARRLTLLNAALRDLDGTSSVTAVHGRFRVAGERVTVELASGGHEPPLVRRATGAIEEVPVAGTLLGLLPDVRLRTVRVDLAEGDCLVAVTDGLADAPGASDRWGRQRLVAVLADCRAMPARAVAERLLQSALEHAGGRAHDDMAVLVLQAGTR